jgi:hypothetical protein
MAPYAGAFVLRDALIKFGSTTYSNQCTKIRLVPDTPIQQKRTLVPDGQVADVDSPTWTMELEGLQDWETGGLAAWFNSVAGTSQTFTVAPRTGSGKKQATGSVIIVNPPFGGEQGEWSEMEMEFPVVGQPTFGAQP